MLAKSKDLEKSVLCMNQHYLELQLYLQEVTKDPSVVFNSKYHVFSSENRLYEEDGKVNHRLKRKWSMISCSKSSKLIRTLWNCLSGEHQKWN